MLPEQEQPMTGPEFSEDEKKGLGFVKHEAEAGKIGGPEDQPSEGREFAMHPELPDWDKIDPAWRSLPPELRDEYEEKFGKRREIRETWAAVKEGRGLVLSADSEQLFIFRVLEKNYPHLEISVRINLPAERAATVIFGKKNLREAERSIETLLTDHEIEALTHFNEGDIPFLRLLEEQKRVPPDTHKRLLSRSYVRLIERFQWIQRNNPNVSGEILQQLASAIAQEREKIKALGVEPYSDAELQFLLEQIIVQKLGPPKQKV